MKNTTSNQELMDCYKANFGANMYFKVPPLPSNVKPDPQYHSIQGQDFYILSWELQDLAFWVDCLENGCCGKLVHDRKEFGKNRKVTSLYGMSGKSGWVVSMKYTCNLCKKQVRADNPILLSRLPSYLRNKYPVDPQ